MGIKNCARRGAKISSTTEPKTKPTCGVFFWIFITRIYKKLKMDTKTGPELVPILGPFLASSMNWKLASKTPAKFQNFEKNIFLTRLRQKV